MTETEKKWGVIGGGLLYVMGAGMLFVLALNAVVLTLWPSPAFPPGGFPTLSSQEECGSSGGTWQGALAVEGGYCMTKEEKDRNAVVDKYTLANRVAALVGGAVTILGALYLVKAGTLVRLALAAGGVMVLAVVSGMPLLFITVSSQTSYLAYGGTGNIPVPNWEAVVAVVAWLVVLLGGYNISKNMGKA